MAPAESFPKIYKLEDRVIIVEKDRFIKRELAKHEFFRRPNGQVIYPYWMRERIQNEADAIAFVAANTSIPMPKHRLYENGGLLHLETLRVPGILLDDVDTATMPAAIEAVTRQMEENILPQLRKLRRHSIGSVDTSLPMVPPIRIYRRDRRSWERVTSPPSEDPPFVFCHNDLSNRNILIDPETLILLASLTGSWRDITQLCEQVARRDLALFGLEPKDLRNCLDG
ncbi:hypothetical protein NEMBOFW57_000886 [Staphylotrichum longicolle]|uniref:Aminoglycoside phosphotransferase domain-containing protein n=1 Tax=Staphylotrichum longicolle TaxID=669026 RepID=A0AAD4I1A2_9PEZI|nr:hypothetical protein NEMBOFW57_000886 [Staphylotrichum longicolle]